jgi:hypothetical protein
MAYFLTLNYLKSIQQQQQQQQQASRTDLQ